MPTLHIRLEVKLQDVWIGLYWKRKRRSGTGWPPDTRTDVWICLVPCLPIHIWWQTP